MRKKTKKKLQTITKIFILLVVLSFMATVGLRVHTLRKVMNLDDMTQHELNLTDDEKLTLEQALNKYYPERNSIIKPLPYGTSRQNLDVGAASAICVDIKNGNILYEKNSKLLIPPASMTKLFVMYIVFKEVESGRIHMEDIVPLPRASWACNMPPHSSLMFLGKNQKVSLEELMKGLAVCSGNDAAYAIGYYISGNMDNFIKRMNEECAKLGLKNTHFEEVSGYSEKNMTTAYEMAVFARHYVDRYPESITNFHNLRYFTYPQEHNIAPEDKDKPRKQNLSEGLTEHIYTGIRQKNTNPLLGKLEGCNGLKTGYIDESGYNLSLTVTRDNMSILSITMGGKGRNSIEGNQGRVHDGTTIMEWAFSNFKDYDDTSSLITYTRPLLGCKSSLIKVVPAFMPKALCIPVKAASNPEDPFKELETIVRLDPYIKGPTHPGKRLGYVEYKLNGSTIQSVALVAATEEQNSNLYLRLADFAAQFFLAF